MTKKTETDDILDIPTEDQDVVALTTDDEVETTEEVSVLSEATPVENEQPKVEKKKCFLATMTLDNWIIVCSLFSIAFQFLATMLIGITSSYVVYQVFAYLGYLSVIAGATIYVVQMLRTKVVAFTPQLILLILAIVITSPLSIPLGIF